MLKTLRCFRKGHWFVDSRSTPGTQVCVRCRHRQPFEGLATQGCGAPALAANSAQFHEAS